MANLSLTRVNQKLAQANALLQQSAGISLTKVQRQSLIEAVSFHLVCGYQHYLRELAETYGLKTTLGISSEVDLARALEAAGKHPAETAELQQLRSGRTWLADLQGFYESLWRSPKPVSQQDDNLISLIDEDATSAAPTLELVGQWHSDFVALVRRHRETSAEF